MAISTSLEKQLDPRGPIVFRVGSLPVFLRKPIAISDYPLVGAWTSCPHSESAHEPRVLKLSKTVKIRNRYNQVPHLTQDTIYESDKNTRQESQVISPFPAGDHKAARHRQDNVAKASTNKIKKIHKKSSVFQTCVLNRLDLEP